MSDFKYSEQVDIDNIQKLRKMLSELPAFFKDFFRGIEPRTQSRTQIAYAYDIKVFLEFLMNENPSIKNTYSKITDVQNQLLDDISHSLYSSIEFERKIRKKTNNYIESVMPIVFTSGIGIDDIREEKWIDNLSYSISQSPQVWLDHQVFVLKGGLYLK